MQNSDCWGSKPCNTIDSQLKTKKDQKRRCALLSDQMTIKLFTNLKDMWHWCHLLSSYCTSTWSFQTWHWAQLQVMKGSLLLFHFLSRLQWQLWSQWWPRQSIPPAREETSSLRRLSWRSADPRSTFLPPTCCWRVQSILFIWISLDGWHCIIFSTLIYSDL